MRGAGTASMAEHHLGGRVPQRSIRHESLSEPGCKAGQGTARSSAKRGRASPWRETLLALLNHSASEPGTCCSCLSVAERLDSCCLVSKVISVPAQRAIRPDRPGDRRFGGWMLQTLGILVVVTWRSPQCLLLAMACFESWRMALPGVRRCVVRVPAELARCSGAWLQIRKPDRDGPMNPGAT